MNEKRDKLILDHLKLAKYFVNKIYGKFPADVKEELVAEANLALVEAAESWDPEKKPFVPYFISKLRYKCQICLYSLGKPLTPPVGVSKKIRKGEIEPVRAVPVEEDHLIDDLTPEETLLLREFFIGIGDLEALAHFPD